MSNGFHCKLAPKNEGLEYDDEFDSYRFGIRLADGTWTVRLPPSKSRSFGFTAEERHRVLPRIRAYLGRIWWFGIFPRSYDVRFVEDPVGASPVFVGPFQIGLTAGRDAIDYRDDYDIYRFPIRPAGHAWIVQLPGTKGTAGLPHRLTDDERTRILPRVRSYLGNVRHRWRSMAVRIIDGPS